MRFHFFTLLAVFSFATPCLSQDWEWLHRVEADSTGVSKRAYHGTAIVGVGDVNEDGFADYAVSARGASLYAPLTGGVQVISGADGNSLATFFGQDSYEGAGYTLAFLGVQSVSGSADAPMLAIGSPLPLARRTVFGRAEFISLMLLPGFSSTASPELAQSPSWEPASLR